MSRTTNNITHTNKHLVFAESFKTAIRNKKILDTPISVATEFNSYSKIISIKPHTVRKWLLGISMPRAEMLLLLAEWLSLAPHELLTGQRFSKEKINKVNFEFDFTDQDVIAKYLSMTVKQKFTVRLLIDAIVEKNK